MQTDGNVAAAHEHMISLLEQLSSSKELVGKERDCVVLLSKKKPATPRL
jgi:hypothetical protein